MSIPFQDRCVYPWVSLKIADNGNKEICRSSIGPFTNLSINFHGNNGEYVSPCNVKKYPLPYGSYSMREMRFFQGCKPDPQWFEHIPIFEAVETVAGGKFSMVDLGAGFGLWSVFAACLCRLNGITPHLSLVEANPEILLHLRQFLRDNGIDESHSIIHEAVMDSRIGVEYGNSRHEQTVPFLVERPESFRASQWMGQSAAIDANIDAGSAIKTGRKYHGHDFYELRGGWGMIFQPTTTMSQVMDKYDIVDLMVMDIQGAELNVLQKEKSVLDKIRNVGIGTHGRSVEAGLRDFFSSLGWERILDFPGRAIVDTNIGLVHFFDDGFQYYANPKFVSPIREARMFFPPLPAGVVSGKIVVDFDHSM